MILVAVALKVAMKAVALKVAVILAPTTKRNSVFLVAIFCKISVTF